MSPVLLALIVATAAPDPAVTGKRRVLVLEFKAQGVDEQVTRTIGDLVANAAAQDDALMVTSGSELRAMIDLEAQKGGVTGSCVSDSCLAEIAGALGADLVVVGNVGRLGELLIVTMSLYDAVSQASVAKTKIEARDLEGLSPKIDDATAVLFDRAKVAPTGTSPLFVGGLVAGAVGGAAAMTSAVFAAVFYGTIEDPEALTGAKDTALAGYPIALGAAVAGAAIAVGGGVVAMIGAPE